MTQPVQEPSQGRQDARQDFGTRQLFRRPAPPAAASAAISRAVATVANFDFDNYAEVPYDSIDVTDDGTVFDLASNRVNILKGGFYMFDIGFRGFTMVANVNTMVDFLVDLVATAPTHIWSNSLTGVTGPSYTGAMRIDDAASVSINGYAYPGVRGFIDIATNDTLADIAVFKVRATWLEDNVSVATNITTNWLSIARLGDTAWV